MSSSSFDRISKLRRLLPIVLMSLQRATIKSASSNGSAHVDITGHEKADKLAKEAKNLNNDNFINLTLLYGNAVKNFKLREMSIPVKHQIYNTSGDHFVTKTIARLRTGHYRGMQIDRDGRKTYRNWDNCLDTELTPA
ncbi:RNase H domain-containing protein [Trichonephila clavipes]|nr:RNase H domain-containing protein [Trichonephila clavipes]